MTKDEAAIISAYTGILIGSMSEFHGYVEEIMGRPVYTNELPDIVDEIKEKSRVDFVNLSVK